MEFRERDVDEKNINEPSAEPKEVYRALTPENERDILKDFTPEQQAEIKDKQRILSSLAHFIGKDFNIPVELNAPGAGWHWNFKENIIRIDPKDVAEKPMDYLRFVICHEGGHRRISRTDFIPVEQWRQPGFSFMMNAIEDPRDNNFVAESYPKFAEQMALAYQQDLDFETKAKEKAENELGRQPRFMQAGFEYIRQWYRETQGQAVEISESLPEEVKAVVNATLDSARDSWLRYPSRQEADTGGKIGRKKVDGETMISEYARLSYEINRDKVWPEFKKLVEQDLEDQKTQEFAKDMQQKQEAGGQGLPQELKDKLTPEEQQQLQDAIDKAIDESKKEQQGDQEGEQKPEQPQKGKPIDMDSLPEDLKQKIRKHIESLPEEQQQEITEKAKVAFQEFEKSLNKELRGKLSEDPEKRTIREDEPAKESPEKPQEKSWQEREKEREAEQRESRKRIDAIFEQEQKGPYQESLEKVSDLIDALTGDLRDIFIKRKTEKYESGYRSGRRWNIRKRIREKIENIPLLKTEAREQPESESEETDYAVTLMVDLSGSMRSGGKIQEAFKSAVILGETLNNLGVQFEIVGFQDVLLEFKGFGEHLDDRMREKLSQMVLEVDGSNPEGHNNPGDNDDGACLRKASEHLANQPAKNKLLFVISDGVPAMDSGRKSSGQLDRELKEAVAEISANTNQKLVGLGLNSKAVEQYYPNNISGVDAKQMAETLAGLLREVIEKY